LKKEAVMGSPCRLAILIFGIFAALIFAVCNRAASQTVPGDLTGDGAVTIADATIALQIAVGIRSPSPQQLAAGDLNGDGKLSISEVTQILRAAVRLIKPEDLIQGPIVTTVVGDPIGFADGSPTVARFQDPEEVAVGPDGSIYVADVLNHSIRRIQPDGTTTTIAGTGLPGYKDGPAKQAQFNSPYGIAVDKSGVIYVADSLNRRIRKITPDGMVSTLAGAPEQRDGYFLPDVLDGPPTKARFAFPAGIDVDADGNVYVADFDANRIRKVAPDGTVTTLAGSGIAGFADGPAREARFNGPSGVAVDKNGTVYVADFYNHLIRAISPKGDVFTLSGNPEVDEEGNPLGGYEDGPSETARFDGPAGISIGANGVLYVADYYNNRIRRVERDGSVTTIAGTGKIGSADGPGAEASFYTPTESSLPTESYMWQTPETTPSAASPRTALSALSPAFHRRAMLTDRPTKQGFAHRKPSPSTPTATSILRTQATTKSESFPPTASSQLWPEPVRLATKTAWPAPLSSTSQPDWRLMMPATSSWQTASTKEFGL
jgi:sugar lactone lactonase YvrE